MHRAKTSRATRLNYFSTIQPPSANFADQVLALEMQIETQGSLEALKQLLEIYSVTPIQRAIEFYESIGDTKYSYYKERMHNTLVKHDRLLGPPLPGKARDLNTEREAENLVKQHFNENLKLSKELLLNIESQSAGLHNRLSLRQIKKLRSSSPDTALSRSFISVKLEQSMVVTSKERGKLLRTPNESDISGGVPKAQLTESSIEQLESELEGLLEKYITLKISKTTEIREKYSEGKKEIRDIADRETLKKVYKAMDLKMNQEIQQLESSLKAQRNSEIQLLKGRTTNSVK